MEYQILCNSLTLVTSTFEPLGLVLDPLLGTANHSCNPNAYAVMDGPKVAFRSLNSISKGEEILISYVDSSLPKPTRQLQIRERFYFDCACTKCERPGGGIESPEDRYLGHPTVLAEEWKTFLEKGYDEGLYPTIAKGLFDSIPQNFGRQSLPPFWDAKCVEKFASEFVNDNTISDPHRGLQLFQFLLRLLATSQRFELQRHPYSSIRKNYTTYLSLSGKYGQAWSQAAKQYFNIDPVLYLQTHHPLRVIDNINLAKLTLVVATDPGHRAEEASLTDPLNDTDFGVMIYFLFVEIMANIDKSHGKDNSLAKSVRAKFEELKTDMTRADPSALRNLDKQREEVWRKLRSVGNIPDLTYSPSK